MNAADFSERDTASEMLEDMKAAAEAIQDHGYRHYRYRFRPMIDDRPQAWHEHDPEPAFNEFLDKLHNPDNYSHKETGYIDSNIKGELVVNLLTENTEDDLEDAVNEILQQVKPSIEMGEQEVPEIHPLDHEVDIIYRVNTRGNYFEIVNADGYKGEQFTKEVADILQDEGYRVVSKP